MIKYIFENHYDFNDCEQCGGTSSSCYTISLNENRDTYLFSTGSLYASCYGNEYPSLSLLHEYCINVLKFNFNFTIKNFDINQLGSLSELVSLYEKENNNVKYEYKEHENYDYYDDGDYDDEDE